MVLNVENVSIRYTTDVYKRMRPEQKLKLRLKGDTSVGEFWAVKDVSFQLNEGDILGIVGKNGAGKSTLLKAIAGTIGVQSGKITRERRVSALLELGTGFDPDLTVKENIYLRSALLGYSKSFLQSKYAEILDFAELGEFENFTYRNLSSGMRSKMAFAIVSVMEPEILVLDEVFSVGDATFQEKSNNRMRELMASDVSTIMVSHSMSNIQQMCNRVIWMERGRIVMDGDTATVCQAYSAAMKTKKK